MSKTISLEQLKTLFPARDENSHKGNFGYIALIGGCVKYSGAIRLAALASSAMRGGAGVCTIAAPGSLSDSIIPNILESTFYPLSDKDGNIKFVSSELDELMDKNDVIAFGMGIGNTSATRKALTYILENYEGILIVDADGINAMAKLDKELIKSHKCSLILTPHPKEFSRLSKLSLDEISKDPEGITRALAEDLNAIVHLKGHTNYISDGADVYKIEKGCAGMATAGSGDVLAGILSAVAASNKDDLLLASAGACYLNGLAGEMAAKEHGEVSMLAGDTAAHIEDAIKEITDFSSEDDIIAAEPIADTAGESQPKPKQKLPFIAAICSIAALIVTLAIWLGPIRNAMALSKTTVNPLQSSFNTCMNYLMKDIYIDGVLVNNYQIEKPFGLYQGKVYTPLTKDVCSALGITAEWDAKDPLVITITKTEPGHSGAFYDLCAWNLADINGLASANETVYIKSGDKEEVIHPDVTEVINYCSGVTMYIPITMLSDSELLDISVYYDNISGLYVSTDKDIPAESYLSENNKSYILGRAEYIHQYQPELVVGDCAKYEYYFRHEANTREIDENLLLAIARSESKFNRYSLSGSGAMGIMQIMPDTAKRAGISEEELYTVHTNIQFGAGYIRDALANFKGDMIKALSVYNFGGNAVLAGAYDTTYANTVLDNLNEMLTWIEGRGYSNELLTEIECTK